MVRNANIPTHFFLVWRWIGVIARVGNSTNSRQFSHEIVRIAWNFWGLHGGALLGHGIPRAGHRAVSQTILLNVCVRFSCLRWPARRGKVSRHFCTFADVGFDTLQRAKAQPLEKVCRIAVCDVENLGRHSGGDRDEPLLPTSEPKREKSVNGRTDPGQPHLLANNSWS